MKLLVKFQNDWMKIVKVSIKTVLIIYIKKHAYN
jgi:hypothetical protein